VHNLLRFDGKTIALTGAASGIGAATLDLLNGTDAEVHAIDLAPLPLSSPHEPPSRPRRSRIGGRTHRAVADQPGCACELRWLPKVGRFTPEQIMAVNWFGLRMLTESVLPNMPEGSAVVHLTSTAARSMA